MKDIKIVVIPEYDTEGSQSLIIEANYNDIYICQGPKDMIYLQDKELPKFIEALQSLKS